MVYNEVMMRLHYMHAASYVENKGVSIHSTDPEILALRMVISFNRFIDDTLLSSSNNVLCTNINVVKLVYQYMMFKDVVTVGDCITVEKIITTSYRYSSTLASTLIITHCWTK